MAEQKKQKKISDVPEMAVPFHKEKKLSRRRPFRLEYRRYRRGGLNRRDAFFNAAYAKLCERSIHSGKGGEVHPNEQNGLLLRAISCVIRFFSAIKYGFRRLLRWIFHRDRAAVAHVKRARFLARSLPRIALALFVVAAGIYLFLSVNSPVVLRAEVQGEVVGIVESYQVMESTIRDLEKTVENILGERFHFPYEVKYTYTRAASSQITEKAKVSEALFAMIRDHICTASGLYVDQTLVAICENEEIIQKELDALIQEKIQGENTGILNEIHILTQAYPTASITDAAGLRHVLEELCLPEADRRETAPTVPVSVTEYYGEKEKKPVPAAALAVDVQTAGKSDRVIYANSLQSYDHVRILFYTSTVERYQQAIPYKTVYEESSSLYTTMADSSVRGSDGVADVQARVYYVDGVEMKREVIQHSVRRKPVDRVISIGTKVLPEDLGVEGFERRFIVPRVGWISSYWGPREEHLSYHRGWDITGKIGDNLYAAASGVVTVAIGRHLNGEYLNERENTSHSYSGYGYVVVIQHEDGYSTLYAHCNRINVRLGQEVKQGEKIAELGNTGNSTGPHVHFEIMHYGTKKNPSPYMYQGTTTIYDQKKETE